MVSDSSTNSSGIMSISSQESKKDDSVLEIYHSAVESEETTDTQKAIIQEMCNVVWKVMDIKKKWNNA